MYPHLIDSILGYASHAVLWSFRQTSTSYPRRASSLLYSHITIASGAFDEDELRKGRTPLLVRAVDGPLPLRWSSGTTAERAEWASLISAHTRIFDYATTTHLADADPQLAAALGRARVMRRVTPSSLPMVFAPRSIESAFLAPPKIGLLRDLAPMATPPPPPNGTRTHVLRLFFSFDSWAPADTQALALRSPPPEGTQVVVHFLPLPWPWGGDMPEHPPPTNYFTHALGELDMLTPHTLVGLDLLPPALFGLPPTSSFADVQAEITQVLRYSYARKPLGQERPYKLDVVRRAVTFMTAQAYRDKVGEEMYALETACPALFLDDTLVERAVRVEQTLEFPPPRVTSPEPVPYLEELLAEDEEEEEYEDEDEWE